MLCNSVFTPPISNDAFLIAVTEAAEHVNAIVVARRQFDRPAPCATTALGVPLLAAASWRAVTSV